MFRRIPEIKASRRVGGPFGELRSARIKRALDKAHWRMSNGDGAPVFRTRTAAGRRRWQRGYNHRDLEQIARPEWPKMRKRRLLLWATNTPSQFCRTASTARSATSFRQNFRPGERNPPIDSLREFPPSWLKTRFGNPQERCWNESSAQTEDSCARQPDSCERAV